MKSINYSKQQGFTLVEIAIVMVIIGLLLGAVLKGQNLINSARVRSMADQNSSVQAAYYGFIDRYRAIPGDMKKESATAAIGTNNLTTSVGGDGNGGLNLNDYGEASALWAHLSAANFIVGNYAGGAESDIAYTANTVAPVNAFGGRVLLWRTKSYQSTGSTSATNRLGFIVGRAAPASVLAELDIKVDDGKPESGVLRGTSGDATPDEGASVIANADGQSTGCVSSTIWDVSEDAQDCNAIYLY